MGDAVDLDEVVAALDRRHDRVACGRRSISRLRAAPEPLDVDDGDVPVELDLDAVRPELRRSSAR